MRGSSSFLKTQDPCCPSSSSSSTVHTLLHVYWCLMLGVGGSDEGVEFCHDPSSSISGQAPQSGQIAADDPQAKLEMTQVSNIIKDL
ncbi:hypothetical protein KP509_35G030900 [Ceratopteris richardii]|uniref:Uncharacterized protein n=1 Tax=Ceratopteris richardii TaxID=49495 RepID=A0A8T2QE91_CERRI|nr:hypothetical protein KP509_35G030900 [Ceratopteris richardii]